ncbi:MAG: hypothetical protein LAO04_18955, partial [Acidobacteriia bacterium]|nr:hypothetical protein [Terriglobia bacterium]
MRRLDKSRRRYWVHALVVGLALKPNVVVALGAVAAKNLLAINAPMSELRGRFYDFLPVGARSSDPSWPGARLAVTYH